MVLRSSIFQRWLGGVTRERFYRIILTYLAVCTCFALLGYWLAGEPSIVESVYFSREPSTKADQEILFPPLPSSTSPPIVTENVSFIQERDESQEVAITYWAPTRPNVWGMIEMEFVWASDIRPELAILEPSLLLFLDYDPTAEGEFAISSAATGNEWLTLVRLNVSNHLDRFNNRIDVTKWVQGSEKLRIRYRLKANRLMYHPTPNDPIGLACAQGLRKHVEEGYASRLRLWRRRPSDYQILNSVGR